ncbi:thermonuclease family protein [Rhizobium sophorae]|uniref:Nuclease n=3 Tax=Rhizobium TaxID=379 RepID=A0A246DRE4_9HYPH|nr:thermonuclease family protein [Rhizobium sp. C104]NNU41113.1 thermonuclease family protein [Rhizobium sophorae]OWO92896.1 nuclease [Rhizobium esperanzae]PCK84521.1 nuclease [Rhizobium sophoriradicis]PDS75320.1 nuclease [Rhizobium sp. L43]ULJ76768.1 thermonuclease family protein [Rhizobium sp. C104]
MAKSNVVPFRRPRKSGGKNDRRSPQRKSRTGWKGPRISLMAVISAIVIAAAGWLAFGGAGSLPGLPAVAKTPAADSSSAAFSICGDGRHVNCVVDGDTFWFQGQKIRIADIDTPELSPPRCEAERIKGEAAKARLLALLNGGNFSLTAGWRDEDKYGRKLRTVTRSGHSIGDTLIDEGLARRWDGARHGWCG